LCEQGKSKVTSQSIAQESTPIKRSGHLTHDDSQPPFGGEPIVAIGSINGAIDAINWGMGFGVEGSAAACLGLGKGSGGP
jgi:hypothetical protein